MFHLFDYFQGIEKIESLENVQINETNRLDSKNDVFPRLNDKVGKQKIYLNQLESKL